MIAAVLFLVFAVLLFIGAPIAVCLGASSVIAMLMQGAGRPLDTVMSSLPMIVSSSTSKFVLLAIPFFIFAGNIMEKAGISGKLIALAESCVGHIRGGLAMVCVIVSCFFAAISGSGPATVAALGVIVVPAMIKSGYTPAFSAALMAAAGAIGVIIPPSITFVVYGSIADASIGQLFLSGLVPGLIMGAALLIVALIIGRKMNLKANSKASGAERWKAFKDAFWGLLMPVIILGGIYGGIFTPTEAAAVSVIYGLFVGIFIYKQIHIKEFYQILIDTASTTATVMFITAAASLFAYVLTRARLDVAISSGLESMTGGSVIVFFIIVNIILLIAGCFLDSTSALYIFTPLFVPVAQALGVDLIHLGVVMIVNLAIGLFTPPVGVNLYVACGGGNVNLKQISKAVISLILAAIIVLLIVTYIPKISLLFI
ncbi:TRAP transporter large permease [Faecalicatena contorta]|uniref:C4-dicarboxylate transporter, DctM subunit n=1 Tax=Faecalicatena contorta TaxID=39482 RepID=A0A315ZSQ3_9FIRM|nr:TRAP transporter large permease [Faecalicatena contorta]PWJ48585.1 C4-dicarboxylate transporter DctM subunit [Faecalicatena contorta]SUQ15321.1 C4-dicarboxylate transporter, DctM subunit [Faecalicatena contorta]